MKTRLLLLVLLFSAVCDAGDWPMFRYNAQRHGCTPEEIPKDLTLKWVYKSHAPRPAWPSVNKRMGNVVGYDLVNQPIVSKGIVFFGSSADGKVYALDADTGQEKWSFYTGGPIRCAPAAWKDRIFVGSDDGYLYCLESATGKLLWKKLGGPTEEKILGNERVVSLWPVRGGPVVLDGKVYFGAGIWGADVPWLHALDAATGKVLWSISNGSKLIPPEKRGKGGAWNSPGLGFRGHLAASGDRLVVPAGRSGLPVFERSTGKAAYFLRGKGSAFAVIADSYLIGLGAGVYDLDTGSSVLGGQGAPGPLTATVTPKWIFWTGRGRVVGMERGGPVSVPNKNPARAKNPKYNGPNVTWGGVRPGDDALIAAGPRLYAGGTDRAGKGVVSAIDIEKKSIVWKSEVEGRAFGLAAADGRLYASTTKGYLYCFHGQGLEPTTIEPKRAKAPDTSGTVSFKAADAILEKAGFAEGYCVDLGCGDGSLTIELVRKSKLYVVGVEKDPAMVKRARERLDAEGLYGVRAVVLEADPAKSFLPKWFANLVVSGRSVGGGPEAAPAAEASRIQRPYGGVVMLGKPGAMNANVRGPLEGGGSWTHFYADAANTACSGDTALRGKLRSFWYRDSEVLIPHGTTPSSMFLNGNLYAMGSGGYGAIDAYNGRTIWQNSIEGLITSRAAERVASRGYACVSPDSLYTRHASGIIRMDLATGTPQATFAAPKGSDGESTTWGMVAYDNGTLYGTIAGKPVIGEGGRPESSAIVAMDPMTGKVKWTYKAKSSIPNPSVTIGGGRVYLIDRPCTLLRGRYIRASGDAELTALDAKDGRVVWKNAEGPFSPILALSVKHDILITSGDGQSKGSRGSYYGLSKSRNGPTAWRASTGEKLWAQVRLGGRSFPVLIGDMVLVKPQACDILTGKPKLDEKTSKPWVYWRQKSKSCGEMSASVNHVVFRSGDLAWFDLKDNRGVEYYGGMRAGCRINAIPVGGLVLAPETNVCGCPYNKASVALQGAE